MLDNTITLPVDVTGANASFTNEVLSRFKELENKTTYRFGDHSLAARNQVDFYRNDISPSGNYLGNAKGALKLTEDQVVTAKDGTDVVAPTIVSLQLSIPVGTTDVAFYHIIGRLQAMLLDLNLMHDLFMMQEI